MGHERINVNAEVAVEIRSDGNGIDLRVFDKEGVELTNINVSFDEWKASFGQVYVYDSPVEYETLAQYLGASDEDEVIDPPILLPESTESEEETD